MADTKTDRFTSIKEALTARDSISHATGKAVKGRNESMLQEIEGYLKTLKSKGQNVSKFREHIESIQENATSLVGEAEGLAVKFQDTAHGKNVVDALGEGSADRFYRDTAKRIENIAEPAHKQLSDASAALKNFAEKAKEGKVPDAEKMAELLEKLKGTPKKMSEAAANAKLSLTNDYLNRAAKHLKGDDLKAATTQLVEGLELEATLKEAGIKGIEGPEAAAKYLRDATKGYLAGMGGVLKAEIGTVGFGQGVKNALEHIYGNPFSAESFKESKFIKSELPINPAKNTIKWGGHMLNIGMTGAGLAMVGDAALRSTNSADEQRSPGTRVTEAILGTALAAKPLLKSVRI